MAPFAYNSGKIVRRKDRLMSDTLVIQLDEVTLNALDQLAQKTVVVDYQYADFAIHD